MDHAHYKKTFFCLILILLSACSSRKPEAQLIKDIEEMYSNLYYNNESYKRIVLSDLKDYLKSHPINDANISEIRNRISRLNDGHVVIFDDRPENNIHYASGIHFIPGSELVESCHDCFPTVPKYKYEILEVNDVPLKKFFEEERYNVAASSEWGRQFRLTRLLQYRLDNKDVVLKLKSISGKVINTKLQWKKDDSKLAPCVTGERIANDVYKVNIYNLWCDESKGQGWTRDQIVNNFKTQFDEALRTVTPQDKILIDLRENGGGGDVEVEYVLNAFYEKSVLMYEYKYLRKTHPGKRKWIERLLPFKMSLWTPVEFDYTNLDNRPKKTFFKNKIATIISPGCFSSCETIASVLKNDKRSKLIGTTTHGGSGVPVIFPIHGTPYSINLPTCVTWQEPGRVYEGMGVLPNIELAQDPYKKEDNVLKAAIDLVQ